jgi:hypothetical protein
MTNLKITNIPLFKEFPGYISRLTFAASSFSFPNPKKQPYRTMSPLNIIFDFMISKQIFDPYRVIVKIYSLR